MAEEVTAPLNEELELSIDILRPITYVISEEEDQLIRSIYNKVKDDSLVFIYRTSTGLLSYSSWEDEIKEKQVKKECPQNDLNIVLDFIKNKAPTKKREIYIFLDINHKLTPTSDFNFQTIRMIKDVAINSVKDKKYVRNLMIVSPILELPPTLNRFVEVCYFDLPSEKEIEGKLSEIINDYNQAGEDEEVDLPAISTDIDKSLIHGLKGLTHYEIEQVALSSLKKLNDLDPTVINDYKKSIIKKSGLLDIMDTGNVTFDKIGGLDLLKEWCAIRGGAFTPSGMEMGIPALKGIMLIGITGCGKTLFSSAIANHWGIPAFIFTPSKCFDSRVGKSEENVRRTLALIEKLSPCLLFIDEGEKEFQGHSSNADAGAAGRIMATFLKWYENNKATVFTVMTCNNIMNLPPELINRFDEKFFVDLPSVNERNKIFQIELDKWKSDWKKFNIDTAALAEKTERFTGREIMQVTMASLHYWWYANQTSKVEFNQKFIEAAIAKKIPTVKAMAEQIIAMMNWVGWDSDKNDGVRAAFANKRGDDTDIILKQISDSFEKFSNS